MSAVEEIHRGVPQRKYSEEHGELPLAENRMQALPYEEQCGSATTLEYS